MATVDHDSVVDVAAVTAIALWRPSFHVYVVVGAFHDNVTVVTVVALDMHMIVVTRDHCGGIVALVGRFIADP